MPVWFSLRASVQALAFGAWHSLSDPPRDLDEMMRLHGIQCASARESAPPSIHLENFGVGMRNVYITSNN